MHHIHVVSCLLPAFTGTHSLNLEGWHAEQRWCTVAAGEIGTHELMIACLVLYRTATNAL